MEVRAADPSERAAVANVIDGAALAVDDETLERTLHEGDVLVAVTVETASSTARILGALVLDGEEVAAVAVRRRRRGQGIGTALVEAAADRRDRLLAGFDADVRPFWESLGFAVEDGDEAGRLHGVRR